MRGAELMAEDLLERLRKTVHPILSSSLAPLALGLQACDSEIRWSSPLVSVLARVERGRS